MPEGFKKVAIIGVGLIGGSLGLALRARASGYRVTGIGRDEKKLRLALEAGAVDGWTTRFDEGLADADIVVVCTPVDVIVPTVRRLLPFLRPGAVVTDAGSVKGSVTRGVRKLFAGTRRGKGAPVPVFIGAHPMTGSEKAGIRFASKDLYKGASVVLTPGKGAPDAAKKAVERMWRSAGANIFVMAPEEHDRLVANTSHLPHVLAFALSRRVARLDSADPFTAKLLAGSFRDLTRIADSNPRDWAAICAANAQELGRAIDGYIRDLEDARRKLGDARSLEKLFSGARAGRKKLLGA
ncbi:MAG: prephenate dehydrogenase [Endomicrobiales bacterium]